VRGDWSEDTQLPQRGRHERVDDRVTTRFGHTGDNPFELAFWDEMLRSPVLGEMFDACKRTCDNAWPQYALNLLGDPALRVWTDRPRDLEVGIRPFELCVDVDNAVSVSVYAWLAATAPPHRNPCGNVLLIRVSPFVRNGGPGAAGAPRRPAWIRG